MSRVFNLQKGEEIATSFRRHWISVVWPLLATSIVTILPFALYAYCSIQGYVPPGLRDAHVFAFAGAWWLLISWMAMSVIFTDYFLDVWIITNRRVIGIEQQGLFDRHISTWAIERIEEAVVHVEGFLPTILNYGTLEIRTAGSTVGQSRSKYVPNPNHVREVIMAHSSRIAALEEANKNQEELLHTISHEVKSYLSKDAAALASIAEGDFGTVPDSVKALAQTALGETRKGVAAVMDMLKGSDLKSGTMHFSTERFDLTACVKSLCDQFRPTALAKGLRLDFSADSSPCFVQGDMTQLRDIVFRNIIDNSIRYTPQGSVFVAVFANNGAAVCSISDTGVGITQDDMKRLFTEGGHGTNSRSINPESTGYGLAQAKKTVENHHGKIAAHSDGAGKGTSFIIALPLVP